MNLKLKIWRQKDAKSKGGFETYHVENISPDTSFLEMLDILNNNLIHEGKEPVVFDHDCREGICGMCSLHINGHAHGPDEDITTCQLHMRKFHDGETIGFTEGQYLSISRSAGVWHDGMTLKIPYPEEP